MPPAATPALSQASLAADAQADATPAAAPAAPDLRWPGTLAYGALGFPLAFVALPLYVLLPHHYATEFGVALATLGALLLGARLFDALVDPWLGRASDRLYARSPRVVLGTGLVAALVLVLGLTALFFPPVRAQQALLLWAWVALVLSYLAFSWLSICHQSWGARLGGDAPTRARIVAWREGAGLCGVVTASVLPTLLGLPVMVAVFAVALALAWCAWALAPRPALGWLRHGVGASELWLPWRQPGFRRLMAVFIFNGIASAIPATLLLFFIQDRLQLSDAMQPLFLGSYFVAAALGLPLWVRLVRRWGLVRTWLGAMVMAVAVFGWAATLGAGDWQAFLLICILSGVALGADLTLPHALLVGLIQRQGDHGAREGAYFGWWSFAAKLNLALAAGLALPLLGWWGYEPGDSSAQGLQALSWAYALLPCALKLMAAALLWFFWRRDPLLMQA